jgi:hypothetical protein
VETGRFEDGTIGLGAVGVDLKGIIWRWVRGFHAALYQEAMPYGSRYSVIPPLPEGRIVGSRVEPVPLAEVTPEFVAEIKRNRATRTLDTILCRNRHCGMSACGRKPTTAGASASGLWTSIAGATLGNRTTSILGDASVPTPCLITRSRVAQASRPLSTSALKIGTVSIPLDLDSRRDQGPTPRRRVALLSLWYKVAYRPDGDPGMESIG